MKKARTRPRSQKALEPAPGTRRLRERTAQIFTRHGRRVLLLLALVLAAYSSSFEAGLLFDNGGIILQDPRVHALTADNLRLILTEGYWHVNPKSGLYRPLTTLSYLLNYTAFGSGTNPAGYHWINFILHAINVALVYALGILVLSEPVSAWALAAIWGLHPLLTESVTNVVGRADLLAAFGVLAGLLCYVKSASVLGRRALGWLAALIAVQAVGLFSKESAAVLPGLMLLFDLTWPERSLLRARARAYAALAIPFAAFFYLRSMTHAHLEIIPSENPLVNADFWTARLTAFKVIGKLLGLFLWPAHLSADYSYNAVPLFGWRMSNWEDAKALLSVAVCVGAVVVAFLWRRTRPLFFFTGFFFVALAPTANVIILIGSIMAERFMYLPSVGLAGCVAVALGALNRRFAVTRPLAAQVTWIAVGAASLALAARTYARNFDWHDERSLWTSTVAVCPDVARAHMNLGHALAQKREGLPQAIAEYRTALRILPDYAQAHYNLGIALAQEGKLPEAIVEYEATLRIQPESADAHNNLGIALSQTAGRMPDAIAEWKTTLRFQPDHAIAHYNLGNALSQTPGGIEDAVAEWQAALRTQPDLADVHYNLGNYYSNIPGRASEAIAEYEAAVLIQPDFAEAHNNLANALARVPGRLQDAITHWKAAVRTRPDLAEAHYNLGNALSQFPGRLPEAIAELETGLRIKPSPEMQQTLDRLRAQH